jgi:hypothetical protein
LRPRAAETKKDEAPIMKLTDALLRLMFRPRVLHSLPGRLRIHLPFLKRVPEERSDIVDGVVELIRVPEAILEVQWSLLTGNALIRYDPEQAGEKEILAFMQSLFEIYLRNQTVLKQIPAERWPDAREKLAGLIRDGVRHRLHLDSRLVLSSDALV